MAEAMSANRLDYNDTQEENDSEESSFSDSDGSAEEDGELHDQEVTPTVTRLKDYTEIQSFVNLEAGLKWIAYEPFSKRGTETSQDGTKHFFSCKGFCSCPKSSYILNHAASNKCLLSNKLSNYGACS